jgi:hypothetical protein
MQKVIDCNKIKKPKNEDEETFEIKVLLCKIGKNSWIRKLFKEIYFNSLFATAGI